MSSTANPPCAACKMQRKKCTPECVFAPYFPAENPRKFACVRKVFGASNVAKILNDVSVLNRGDAVKSLAFEAEARLRDPVYGCVSTISSLQLRLNQLQSELIDTRKEIATYIGKQALLPNHVMGFNRQELLTINVSGGGSPGGYGGYPLAGKLVSNQVDLHSQQWMLSQKSEGSRSMGPYTRALYGI